ncbi:hypothetical protein ACETK8_19315 [Brevundimonas staleyi]|uniref:DUF4262 domain-containing protein n=1 Tax=Brevundimonas staleyi TaxID=74326 RepID=A0ABW0FQK1_9CAUL
MITPTSAGVLWRDALIHKAASMGWSFADVHADGPPPGATGLFFAHHASAMRPELTRCIVSDPSAVGTSDPSVPAGGEDLIIRSHALAETEIAARLGAPVLAAARYQLEFPFLGLVERREGERYHIHPLAAESPLALYDEMPVKAGATANWAPHWFAYPEGLRRVGETTWIDVTGRMRPLVFGPYIHLPQGRWRVDVRFAVDPERGHVPLLFEWGTGNEYCRVMSDIQHRGAYGINLDRIWDAHAPAQLRIWTAHPVFEGLLDFQSCRVTRVADDDPSPPTPTDRIVEVRPI